MKRRSVIAGLAALLCAPERSGAQQTPAKIPRIGILSPAAAPSTKAFDAFRDGLRELGYIDGANIKIVYRLASCLPSGGTRRARFVGDSPLEGDGFELLVPPLRNSPSGAPCGFRSRLHQP